MAGRDGPGATADDPLLRSMFTREYLLESDWYRQRLETKQRRDVDLWANHVRYLEAFLARPSHRDVAERMDVAGRLRLARRQLEEVRRPQYVQRLRGTIGADPLTGEAAAGRRAEVGETVGAR
jgi:hypothetical protein